MSAANVPTKAPRYALYFTPVPDSPLWQFGTAWLGRDPGGGRVPPRPDIPGFEAQALAGLTAEASRYGFHATLKAPFRLAPGKTEADLHDALMKAAGAYQPQPPITLQIADLRGFLALVPTDNGPARALGDWAVETFEPFRAPPNEEELAKRRRSPLTPRQDTYLIDWGYPYVFEDFQFHLTLSARLTDRARRDHLHQALTRQYNDTVGKATEIPLEAVSLLREEPEDRRFVLMDRVSLGS